MAISPMKTSKILGMGQIGNSSSIIIENLSNN